MRRVLSKIKFQLRGAGSTNYVERVLFVSLRWRIGECQKHGAIPLNGKVVGAGAPIRQPKVQRVMLPSRCLNVLIKNPICAHGAQAGGIRTALRLAVDEGLRADGNRRNISAQCPSSKVASLKAAIDHEIWRRCGIIVCDGADALTVADGGAVGRIRQSNVEGLVRLDLGVAVDRDGERLRVLVRSEMQRVGGCDIITV